MTTIKVEDDVRTHVTIDCKCGQPAKLIAHRHLIDACNGELAETPDGSEVHPVCVGCARLLHESVARDLGERVCALPDGMPFTCRTCARSITALHSCLEWELA